MRWVSWSLPSPRPTRGPLAVTASQGSRLVKAELAATMSAWPCRCVQSTCGNPTMLGR